MSNTYMAGVIASFTVVLVIVFPSAFQLMFSLLLSATAVAAKLAGIY